MINRAQLKWHNYSKQKHIKNQAVPLLSKSLKTKTKEMLWVSVLAMLFGIASINGLHPFGLSFLAANVLYRRRYILPTAFSSFLGVLIVMQSFASLRYLGSMVIFLAIFRFIDRTGRTSELKLGLTVFLSNMLSGAAFLIIRGMSPYDLFLLVMESSMASVMTFIIPGGLPWIFKKPILTMEKNICMAVLTGVILSISRNFALFGVNIRDVLGVFAVLCMALIDGPGVGAATGIIIGITGFYFSLSPWSTAVMAFSGLVSGSFNRLGKFGVIIGFSLGYLLYNLYVNSMGEAIISLPVLVASYAIFLLLPSKITRKLKLYLSDSSCDKNVQGLNSQELAGDRLHELAILLEDFGGVFEETLTANKDRRALSREYLDNVCHEAQLKVCSSCGMRRICWERELKRTVGAFYKLIKRQEGLDLRSELPFIFKSRCSQTEKIKKIIDEQSNIFNIKLQMNNIVESNQELIQERFKKAADIVKSLATGISEETSKKTLDERLLERLSNLGVSVERIYSDFNDGKAQINIVKPSCHGNKQCDVLIPLAATDVLGENNYVRVIDCPLKSRSQKCRLKISSRGKLEVSVGVAGVAKQGQNISGDGFSFMELKEGDYMLALCDGMGVGKKAAQHSERTLALVERLLEAGYDHEAALEIVNSAMIATSTGEGFCTMDLAIIDTFSGKTKFLKSGAPTSFVKRGSKVEMIAGESLPIGIIDEISPKITEKKLKPGDIIVMVTDGVVDACSEGKNGEEILQKFLARTKTSNPQNIAEGILKNAKQKNSIRDDMTVLVAMIWKNRASNTY